MSEFDPDGGTVQSDEFVSDPGSVEDDEESHVETLQSDSFSDDSSSSEILESDESNEGTFIADEFPELEQDEVEATIAAIDEPDADDTYMPAEDDAAEDLSNLRTMAEEGVESEEEEDAGNATVIVDEDARDAPQDDSSRTIAMDGGIVDDAEIDQTHIVDDELEDPEDNLATVMEDGSAPPSDGDVEATLVSDEFDESTSESAQTMISDDFNDDQSSATFISDDFEMGQPNREEQRTIATNWSDAEADSPRMTIKSRGDVSMDNEGLAGESISEVPTRSMLPISDIVHGIDSPEYELVKVLGEGGMGVVWTARQTSVDREVAVKMIKGPMAKKRSQRQKFLAEAIVTGDLDHPNIVPIYDVGSDHAGTLFYSMKKVKGIPWQDVIKKKSLHENLEILLRTCDAMAFSHDRGIVHRDLKPENIMLGDYGEVLVMDWGLALPTDAFDKAEKLRQSTSMGGTPAYMAPEMASGPITRISPLSDVYLLGAILFEMITGKPPHSGRKVQECLLNAMRNVIRETDHTGELMDIARKAMSTDVADRHQSVREFQEAIRGYLAHSESISMTARAHDELKHAHQTDDYNDYARAVFGFTEAFDLWPDYQEAHRGIVAAKLAYAQSALSKGDYDLADSLLEQTEPDHQQTLIHIRDAKRERDARQQRLRLARRVMIGMAVCIFAIVSGAFFWIRSERNFALQQKEIAEEQKVIAEEQKVIAEDQRDEAKRQEQLAIAAKAEEAKQRLAAEEAKEEEAKQRLAAEMAKEEEAKQRLAAVKAQMEAEERRKQAELAQKKEAEQRMLAVQAQQEAVMQKEVAVKAREKEAEQRKLAEMAQMKEAEQRALAVQKQKEAEEQRQLAIAAKEAEEYEAYIARIGLAAAKIDENAFDVAVELLEQCPKDMRNWEWGRLMHLCQQASNVMEADGPVDAVAMSPDGTKMVTGSWDHMARVWDVKTQGLLLKLPHEGLYVHSVAWSPDGNVIVTTGNDEDAKIRFWNAETGEQIGKADGHTDSVVKARFSPDGSLLLTCSYDETAKLWNIRNPQAPEELHTFEGHSWWVWDGAFSPQFDLRKNPDSNRIVTVGQDGKAIVWKLEPDFGDAATFQVAYQESSSVGIKVTQEAIFADHDGPIYTVAFAPNGELIASAGYDKRILLWSVNNVPEVSLDELLAGKRESADFDVLEGHTAPVQSLAFSKEGDILVSGGRDNAVKVWSLKDLKAIKTLRGHYSGVRSVALSADGRNVISGGQDNRAIVWSLDNYEEFRVLNGRTFAGHDDAILAATFSNDGDEILTASRDRTARTWSTETGNLLQTFKEGHDYLAANAVFSPNGRMLITAAADNTVRLWNVETGTQALRLDDTGRAAALALSYDGRWLATGSDQDGVKLWDMQQLQRLSGEHDAATSDGYQNLDGHNGRVGTMAFSPVSNHLLTCDTNGRCILTAVDTGEILWNVRHHTRRVTGAVFTADGEQILTSSTDQTVSRINAKTGEELPGLILKHDSAVNVVAISSDGERILTASSLTADDITALASRLQLWDRAGKLLGTADLQKFAVTDIAFAPNSRNAILVGSDNTVRELKPEGDSLSVSEPLIDFSKLGGLVWSADFTADGQSLLTVGGSEARLWNAETLDSEMSFSPPGAVAGGDFSPNGDQIITGSWDNSARIWDAQSGKALLKLENGHDSYINSVRYSPDGTKVLTASDDGTAKLWDAATGKVLVVYQGHSGRVRQAVFSPDGKRIATASSDRTVRIWDTETGKPIGQPLQAHRWAVLSLAFSPDGEKLATGSEDNEAKLWNLETSEVIATFQGHTAAVTSVAFTPDGQRLLTASQDNTAKLWDASNGREGTEILTLTGHDQELTSVSVSKDGHRILTASRDGTAILWLTQDWMPNAQ